MCYNIGFLCYNRWHNWRIVTGRQFSQGGQAHVLGIRYSERRGEHGGGSHVENTRGDLVSRVMAPKRFDVTTEADVTDARTYRGQ